MSKSPTDLDMFEFFTTAVADADPAAPLVVTLHSGAQFAATRFKASTHWVTLWITAEQPNNAASQGMELRQTLLWSQIAAVAVAVKTSRVVLG